MEMFFCLWKSVHLFIYVCVSVYFFQKKKTKKELDLVAGSLNWVTSSPCNVFLNSLNFCIKAKTSQMFDLNKY